MGRKGVSKRKPKKSRLVPGTDVNNSSNEQKGGRSPIQSLVKDKNAPVNKGDRANPPAGSNKTQTKR